MNKITEDLLRRIAERASDPMRRYMTAAEDETKVVLHVDEIALRKEDWTRRLIIRSHQIDGRELSKEQLEHYLDEHRVSEEKMAHMMEEQRKEWGQPPLPTFRTVLETEHQFGVSDERPGAKPLAASPEEQDWTELELLTGPPIPDDLRLLYSISDGGFGPGFTGLNTVEQIGYSCNDLRRRGPDYCGTVVYADSFLPIAEEMLNYHYDVETGRIISSNQHWSEQELEPEDIYQIAFQSLADMMEDWLARS